MTRGRTVVRLAAALAAGALGVAACGGSDDGSDGTSGAGGGGAGANTASAARGVSLGKGKAKGEFAIASASGTIKRPRGLRVAVGADPDQQVAVSYTLTCARRNRAAIATSDRIVADTPIDQALQLPRGRLRDCVVAATVQLSDKGTVDIALNGESAR